MVHILLRRTKNNPVIIGEAGVGKTALVEGLAQMMADGKVTPDLARKRIIQLDISSLIAGASHRGEFEERLQGVIKEVMASQGQIVLFIDEIHTILGAGSTDGALDASNIVKPYLSRGQIQIIGATTTSEYRKNFEKDRAFERRFQPIICDEPTEEVAIKMISILKPKYEKFHGVEYSDEAIKAAVHLSKRYVGERFLPDKAIDLMDEAAAEVKLAQSGGVSGTATTEPQPANDPSINPAESKDNSAPSSTDQNQTAEQNSSPVSTDEAYKSSTSKKNQAGIPIVEPTDIEKVVSRWTGIPITKLTEKESEKLLHMEDIIHKSFINHERAVTAVAEAIRRGRIGLASASRPIASFIFLGPTGTGKTELAKVLAEIMFGKKDAMIRLDMSEYMEKHEVAKLVGAPPGYVGYEEGGQLTEAVRNKPYSIVLLDEIEKAHPDVFNILLQLLEDGRLTDNKGNTISFKNTVIIATSNIGSQLIQQKLQELNSTPNSIADIASQPAQQSASVTPPTATSNPNGVPANPADPNATQVAATGTNQNQPVAQTVAGVPAVPGQPVNPTSATPPVVGAVQNPVGGPANSIVTQASSGEDENDPAVQKKNKVFKELSSIVMGELTKHFRPELINRFDEVVMFEPLSQENMMQIARLGIEGTKKMLKEQGIDLQVSEAALRQLAKEGYDPAYGARPLRRLIQRSIENPIAIYLIQRSAGKGDTILIDYDNSKDAFTFTKQEGQNTQPGNTPATPPVDPNAPTQPATPVNDIASASVPSDMPIDEAPPVVTPPPGENPPQTPPPSGAGEAKQLPEWLDQVTENAQGTGQAPEEMVDAGAGNGDNNQTAAAGGTT
jgi:ATP-dependent Clp protease ATP-binding subunit ClpA